MGALSRKSRDKSIFFTYTLDRGLTNISIMSRFSILVKEIMEL